MCRSEVRLVKASITGFYQTISVNAGICQHLLVKVRNERRFYDVLSESVKNKKENNFYLTRERYNYLLNEVKVAKSVKGKQTVQYRRLKRYDILNIGGEEKLTEP
jgi:predicted CopG family antitoxin